MKKIVVTGAGGFIGHHLVRTLKQKGAYVVGVDVKKPEFSCSDSDEFWFGDLRNKETARHLLKEADEVYALAADVGGVGHLSRWNYEIIKNNLEINLNTMQAVMESRGRKMLLTSSACVYPQFLQNTANPAALREEQAIPADPEGSYGWEKLIAERMLLHASEDTGLEVRIARFQNVYGPEEVFQGGREKVIGALCRKVALAKSGESIEIWGDGKQSRTFCYVQDCADALIELMDSKYRSPLNISGEDTVLVDEIAYNLIKISEKELSLNYVAGAQGVRGRRPDNSRRKEVLKWTPKTDFIEGLAETYRWVESQLCGKNRAKFN